MPSGPPTPIGGAQTINPSILRNSSGQLVSGAQVELVGSQPSLPSLVSQYGQFGNYRNMNVLGSISNVNSLMSNNFSNGGFGPGTCNSSMLMNLQQRNSGGGLTDMVGPAEPDPLRNFQNPPGNQLRMEHSQVEASSQSIHQQFSVPQGPQQSLVDGLGRAAPVKIEQQMSSSDQVMSLQRLPSLRNLSSVKLEGQQLQTVRNLGPVKLDHHQQPDPSLFLQHQQEQQVLHSSRQTSQTAAPMNLLQQQQQQRISQMQQQQQLLKTLPQQKQALNLGSQVKPVSYEPGICAQRLTHYMYHQQHRPADNNIEFWRKFVKEYFAPHAKKRWCVSLYGNGRQTSGVFPQDVWHCELCKRKPGRGFETTVEVLPRLLKIKYDSGTQEELLYVDMPREYQNASGQIVLDYTKAIQESVFEQLRVVRDGQLRVVFSSDLKICSWEFCARRHEELIPRRLIVPHVSELGLVTQKYQTSAQNDSSNANLSAQDLQNTCNAFVTSARQMAKSLEVPLVNDLGYTKRYVRCLQISEVVNSMKDLIEYSRETGTSPMTSLVNFPQRNMQSGVRIPPSQQVQEQLPLDITGINSSVRSGMQTSAAGNGTMSLSNISSRAVSPTTSASAIAGLLHQNSMKSRQENPTNNFSNLYSGGNTMRIPSAVSSNFIPQSQPDPSPFLSAAPSTPNNHVHKSFHNNTSHLNPTNSSGNVSSVQQLASPPNDAKLNNAQSSMHQIIQEMMMSSHCNGPSMANDTISVSGIPQPLNGGNYLVGNHNMSMGIGGFRMTGANGSAVTASGIRAALANSTMSLNVGVGMKPVVHDQSLDHRHQLVVGNRLLSNGLGMLNGHSNGQFDWKQTP